ncbi:MAG: metallophosphoesterase [Thermoguttaceae bacterium]
MRNIYQISDLHIGDGGSRDNFAVNGHRKDFNEFLDMVEDNSGLLVVTGDLFELWQSNISKVLTSNEALLDRLHAMGAVYILGNHDSDLNYFTGKTKWLSHPFFQNMRQELALNINGQIYYFIHGHQADQYCCGDTPGFGRITAIWSGLAEDKNGSPIVDKYRTVEDRTVGRLERISSFFSRLMGKPDRFTVINRGLAAFLRMGADKVFCGHTHFAGHIGDWHYNSGTWAETTNSFVLINQYGTVGVFDWANGQATPNDKVLPT